MEKILSPHGFSRCNSCYLVNLQYIRRIDGYTVYVGETPLAISHPRRKDFLAAMTQFCERRIVSAGLLLMVINRNFENCYKLNMTASTGILNLSIRKPCLLISSSVLEEVVASRVILLKMTVCLLETHFPNPMNAAQALRL